MNKSKSKSRICTRKHHPQVPPLLPLLGSKWALWAWIARGLDLQKAPELLSVMSLRYDTLPLPVAAPAADDKCREAVENGLEKTTVARTALRRQEQIAHLPPLFGHPRPLSRAG